MKRSVMCRALFAVAVVSLVGTPAGAQSLEAFYRNVGLQIVVGYGPGGGYDAYARIVGRHIGRHLPGQPTVVVQSMPGAGSMKAANYIYHLAPKDGSQIATFSRGLPMQPLLDPKGIQFDAQKFGWIGSVADEVSVVFAWAAKGFTSFDDVSRREMLVAATGSGADSAIFPLVMNSVLGTKFRVISGYPDSNATMLAVERGEVDGSAATSWGSLGTTRKAWLDTGRINLLGQVTLRDRGGLPNVPHVLERTKNETDRRILELIFSRQAIAYPYTAPPGVPPERLAALRAAFDATMKDEAFLADAKRAQLDIDPIGGEAVQRIMTKVYDSPSHVVERTRAAITEGEKRSLEGKVR